MKTVRITLSNVGIDTGPFNLYYDSNNLIQSGVSKNDLLIGYEVDVPSNANSIRVESDNSDCDSSRSSSIPAPTTTTSTTTTTTAAPVRNILSRCSDGTEFYLDPSSLIQGDPLTAVANQELDINTRVMSAGVTYIVVRQDSDLSGLTAIVGEIIPGVLNCFSLVNGFRSSTSSSVSTIVCNLSLSVPVYIEGDYERAFSDESGATPFNGLNRIWRISKLSDQNSYGASISNDGYITLVQGCVEQTTRPPTTLGTLPPTTSTPGGGGCLGSGTLIEMFDGQKLPVEHLSKGDIVKSVKIGEMPDGGDINILRTWETSDINVEFTNSTVKGITEIEKDHIYDINNGLLITSNDHIHIAKRGSNWITLLTSELLVGDKLINKEEKEIEISKIDIIEGNFSVWKLDVEPNDTFIANDIITHNKDEFLDPGR